MIDSIGDDWAGGLVLRDFQKEGVETEAIEIHRGQTTAISNILVSARDGARAIMFLPGSAPEPSLSESQKTAIQSAKILHITGRYWKACMQAIDLAKERNVRVSFDGGADRFKPEMKTLVPLTDICIVARDFAEKYTGESDPSLSAKIPSQRGSRKLPLSPMASMEVGFAQGTAPPSTSLRSFSPIPLIQQDAATVITEPSLPAWSKASPWRRQPQLQALCRG